MIYEGEREREREREKERERERKRERKMGRKEEEKRTTMVAISRAHCKAHMYSVPIKVLAP